MFKTVCTEVARGEVNQSENQFAPAGGAWEAGLRILAGRAYKFMRELITEKAATYFEEALRGVPLDDYIKGLYAELVDAGTIVEAENDTFCPFHFGPLSLPVAHCAALASSSWDDAPVRERPSGSDHFVLTKGESPTPDKGCSLVYDESACKTMQF